MSHVRHRGISHLNTNGMRCIQGRMDMNWIGTWKSHTLPFELIDCSMLRTFLWYNAAGTLCVRLSIKNPRLLSNAIIAKFMICGFDWRWKTEIFRTKFNCVSISQYGKIKKHFVLACTEHSVWMSFNCQNSRTFSAADKCLPHDERHLYSNDVNSQWITSPHKTWIAFTSHHVSRTKPFEMLLINAILWLHETIACFSRFCIAINFHFSTNFALNRAWRITVINVRKIQASRLNEKSVVQSLAASPRFVPTSFAVGVCAANLCSHCIRIGLLSHTLCLWHATTTF